MLSPQDETENAKRLSPCPICGSTSYTWGQPSGMSFRADGVSKMKALLDAQQWRARLCLSCGNVQNFLQEKT